MGFTSLSAGQLSLTSEADPGPGMFLGMDFTVRKSWGWPCNFQESLDKRPSIGSWNGGLLWPEAAFERSGHTHTHTQRMLCIREKPYQWLSATAGPNLRRLDLILENRSPDNLSLWHTCVCSKEWVKSQISPETCTRKTPLCQKLISAQKRLTV